MANPLENDYEKLTHIHTVVYTWWCWHICKGDEVGVDVDQLGEETELRKVPQSGPDAEAQRPVSSGSQHAASVCRLDAGSESDWTLEVVSGPVVGQSSVTGE